jgi:hypothetical protein
MRIKLNYIAPLLAAGAAAVAISAAPIAAAASAPAPHGACDTGVVSGSICGTPGDVGINASAPPVSFDPYGGEGLLLGGFGRGFRGGFPGGGFGGGGFHGGGGGHGGHGR